MLNLKYLMIKGNSMTTIKTSTFIKLNDVRLSFPSIFSPKVWVGSSTEPKYEATFILDEKLHKNEIDLINAKIDELLIPHKTTRAKIKSDHLCLKEGNLSDREEYQNSYTIKAKSRKRIPIIDKDAITPITENDNIIFAGCYVSAYIDLWIYSKPALGIGVNLKSLQFRKKGPSFEGMEQDIRGAYDPIIEDEIEDDLF